MNTYLFSNLIKLIITTNTTRRRSGVKNGKNVVNMIKARDNH